MHWKTLISLLIAIILTSYFCGYSEATENETENPTHQSATTTDVETVSQSDRDQSQPPSSGYYRINAHEHVIGVEVLPKLMPIFEDGTIDELIVLASPDQTLGRSREKGFTGYDRNNAEVLELHRKHPDKFHVLGTFPPDDPDLLPKIKRFLRAGGAGIKFYHGHGNFYPSFNMTLDDSRLDPVFRYLEAERIPILFHINLGRYYDETDRLFSKFPNLVVNIPHLGVSIKQMPSRIIPLLRKYPNVYTDVSFGNPAYAKDFMRIISEQREFMTGFINRYRKRIMFGSDQVIVPRSSQTEQRIRRAIQSYIDMLEKDQYYNYIAEEGLKNAGEFTPEACQMRGLALPSDVLQDIYVNNPRAFLSRDR